MCGHGFSQMSTFSGALRVISLASSAVAMSAPIASSQSDFEGPPIHYHTAPVNDAIAQLKSERRERSKNAAVGSRRTVGSHRSLMRWMFRSSHKRWCSRRPVCRFHESPRAGLVRCTSTTMFMSVGSKMGTWSSYRRSTQSKGRSFYTVAQKEGQPTITRDGGHCNVCHASSRTQNVPGFLVRSTYPGRDGTPLLFAGNTDDRSHDIASTSVLAVGM